MSERKPQKRHTAVRVDEKTEARINAVRAAMGAPYRDATTSDVLRAAILVGLEILEEKHRPETARSRRPARRRGARA